jgi:hypothetical protein
MPSVRTALPALAFALAGCGPTPPAFRVTGTVTYQGQRLTTGAVAFHNLDGASPLAKGEIRPDGTFELTTHRPGDGAPAGEYKVTVTSMIPGQGVEWEKGYVPPKPLIPLKYMRLADTPLRAAVRPQDDNVVDLSLTP